MVIPSIDLSKGRAVQLVQGKKKVVERDDPVSLARAFDKFGKVAVIDLDAASGSGDNTGLVRDISGIAECRVGGGIRSTRKAREILSYGAEKVIIGSKAFENDRINRPFLEELSSAIGPERTIIAVDAVRGEIVTEGWRHKTGLSFRDVLGDIEDYCSEFLFTCVEREGTMTGIDKEAVECIVGMTHKRIVVAGGVASLDEIAELGGMGTDVQLGMALYTERIRLEEAFVESLNWRRELLPTVTQDISGQVLMVGCVNKDSLRRTLDEGRMWYYSRSKQRLWMKGEISGHVQTLIRMRADCDGDALLATVEQAGRACHTGSYSCFGDRKFCLGELYDVIRERIDNPRPTSYTSRLTDSLVREKLREEVQEIIEAEGREAIVWEASDIVYFLTVLLARNGIDFRDILNELRRRRMT